MKIKTENSNVNASQLKAIKEEKKIAIMKRKNEKKIVVDKWKSGAKSHFWSFTFISSVRSFIETISLPISTKIGHSLCVCVWVSIILFEVLFHLIYLFLWCTFLFLLFRCLSLSTLLAYLIRCHCSLAYIERKRVKSARKKNSNISFMYHFWMTVGETVKAVE